MLIATVFIGGIVIPLSSIASEFNTPEAAIKALEAAYIAKDVDAAVGTKDFREEARLMLKNIRPKFSSDAEILKQTAEVLELAFRKEIEHGGFPNFSKLKCTLAAPMKITDNLVMVRETCLFPDGGISEEDLHVFKGANGWRVVNVPK